MLTLWLFLSGLAGGFLGGMIGVGGGLLFILVLPEVFAQIGMPQKEIAAYTVANSLFAIFFNALSASFVNWRNKNFFPRPVLITAAFGIVSTLLTLAFVVESPWYDETKFNVLVTLLLLYMLYRTLAKSSKIGEGLMPHQKKPYHYGLLGLGMGLSSALTGLGGGVVMVPVLNSVYKIGVQRSNSLSLGVIMVTAFGASVYNLLRQPAYTTEHFQLGYIVLPLVGALAGGVLIGSPFGAKLASKLPPKVINFTFAAFLLAVIIRKSLAVFWY